jgi:hypothetical protein
LQGENFTAFTEKIRAWPTIFERAVLLDNKKTRFPFREAGFRKPDFSGLLYGVSDGT